MNWDIWNHGLIATKVEVARPQLALWEKKDQPRMIEFNAYVAESVAALSPLPESGPLSLHMEIEVKRPQDLQQGNDLDNYLFPLFDGGDCLPSARFVRVSARKKMSGGSQIVCATALSSQLEDGNTWQHFALNVGSGVDKQKERLYTALKASNLPVAPSGPLALRIAWRCSNRSRNWAKLWKGTIDSMGPVLGYLNPRGPFDPNDGRIVDLQMHLTADETLGHDVIVGLWWRAIR